MEKFKAEMMGHFPSVQVEYEELAQLPSQRLLFLAGPTSYCASEGQQ